MDGEKCLLPRECRRCLELCPEFVFMTYPLKRRMPFRKAGDWIIVPVHQTLCTACMICVNSCPEGAITVVD